MILTSILTTVLNLINLKIRDLRIQVIKVVIMIRMVSIFLKMEAFTIHKVDFFILQDMMKMVDTMIKINMFLLNQLTLRLIIIMGYIS